MNCIISIRYNSNLYWKENKLESVIFVIRKLNIDKLMDNFLNVKQFVWLTE